MSELPNSWCSVSLNEICSRIVDGSHNPPKGVDAGYPMLSARNIVDNKISFDNFRWIDEADFESEHARTQVAPGDVLLTIVGTIGRTAVVPATTEPFALQRSVAVLKPAAVNSRYLAYALDSPAQQNWFLENAKGTAQKGLYLKTLGQACIPLAPEAEQLLIVEKLEELLSDLDAGVAELKAAQRKLAQYRQSLLKAAVDGTLTADWRAAHGAPEETGAELLQRILAERRARWEQKQLARFAQQGKTPSKGWQARYEDPVGPDPSGLPPLPDGWIWASVDQLSFVIRGASPRPAGDPRYFGGEMPWITVGSLTADEGMYLDSVDQFVTTAGKDVSRYIESNTLLLTNSGATLGVPKITRLAGCINDGSVALLDVDDYLKRYLYWFLRTQTKRLRALNQGAAQPNLNTDIVRRICVPLAPRDEMESINDLLDKAVQFVVSQENSIVRGLKQAAAQRKNILKAAFAGQLVPQDPNDEPASALLARIRAEREQSPAPRGRRRAGSNRAPATSSPIPTRRGRKAKEGA